MSDAWQYQVRVYLNDELAELARNDPSNSALAPLPDILGRHNATVKNHYDAFAEYVSEAEKQGVEQFPLYKWTKATIEDPEKRQKHLRIFTVHLGGEEIYSKAVADALEAELLPLVDRAVLTRVSKHDTNPSNNPQMPEQYRP